MQQLYRALINMFGTPTLGFSARRDQAKKGKAVVMMTAQRMRAVVPVPRGKEVISVQLGSTTIIAEAVEVPEMVVARRLAKMVLPGLWWRGSRPRRHRRRVSSGGHRA